MFYNFILFVIYFLREFGIVLQLLVIYNCRWPKSIISLCLIGAVRSDGGGQGGVVVVLDLSEDHYSCLSSFVDCVVIYPRSRLTA